MPWVFQHLGCHRINCILDSCTNFDHTTKFWMEYLVLYIAAKDKIQWGLYRGNEGAKGLDRPAQPTGLEKFIQRLLLSGSVWRGTILLQESLWLKGCHLRDCKQITTGCTESFTNCLNGLDSSASTEGLPVPFVCRTLPVSWKCPNHRLKNCLPRATPQQWITDFVS
jgi:hypothetical protein